MVVLLLLLPWIALGAFALLRIRLPVRLPAVAGAARPTEPGREGERAATSSGAPAGADHPAETSLVSIVVPARNEEATIEACLRSLTSQDYPAFEILVVDDQSSDRTAEIVPGIPRGRAREVRLVPGAPLPEGWFGKPWACAQGAALARGSHILFTDADTVHEPGLLARAIAGLEEDRSDVLTLLGRQVMETFWEQLLQPQFFMLLAFRFPRAGAAKAPGQWRHAIANGQYLLFRGEAYQALGGHRAVMGEVVEDMRLAQLLVRGGWRLAVRRDDGLSTRMYRSLPHLVEGWSKGIATGAYQATARWLQPAILPLSFLTGLALWLLPLGVLLWSLAGGVGGTALAWSACATACSAAAWGTASAVMRGNPLYGLLYPLGSVVAAWIFVKSWARGSSIEWKGRTYRMSEEARKGGGAR